MWFFFIINAKKARLCKEDASNGRMAQKFETGYLKNGIEPCGRTQGKHLGQRL